MCEEQHNHKVASGKGAIETEEGTKGYLSKAKGHWEDFGFIRRNAKGLKNSEQKSSMV